MPTINDLSNEILMEVFSYIRVQERQRLATVCKRWGSIIEMMWRTAHKLIMNIGSEMLSYLAWEGANCANILCKNISDAVKILKKLNGNLTKLDLAYNYFMQKLSASDELEWNELCKEMKKNERLISVKINNNYLNDKNMNLQFLQCIPTNNLRHLCIPEIRFEHEKEFTECINKLVRTPLNLEYLNVQAFAPWMERIIGEIDTLEFLYLGDYACSKPGYYSLTNIMKFSNLRELTVSNYDIVNDEFLTALGNSGKSLRALDLRCDEYLSQSAFDCIGNLENLSYLQLSCQKLLNIEIICNLRNLEELYLELSWPNRCSCEEGHLPYVYQQLQCVLENLPKLKRCYFHDSKIHDVLILKKIVDQSQLQEPPHLDGVLWRRTFGVPEDHCILTNFIPNTLKIYSI